MNARDAKDQQRAIAVWRQSATRDWATAEDTFRLGHSDWSLFIAHLAIEKLLKALVIQAGETPPYTHDLEQLVRLTGIDVSEDQRLLLQTITRFNLETRYPDERAAFAQTATKVFTSEWINHCRKVFQWLNQALD